MLTPFTRVLAPEHIPLTPGARSRFADDPVPGCGRKLPPATRAFHSRGRGSEHTTRAWPTCSAICRWARAKRWMWPPRECSSCSGSSDPRAGGLVRLASADPRVCRTGLAIRTKSALACPSPRRFGLRVGQRQGPVQAFEFSIQLKGLRNRLRERGFHLRSGVLCRGKNPLSLKGRQVGFASGGQRLFVHRRGSPARPRLIEGHVGRRRERNRSLDLMASDAARGGADPARLPVGFGGVDQAEHWLPRPIPRCAVPEMLREM